MGYVPHVPWDVMSFCSCHARYLNPFFCPQKSDYRANLRPHFKIIPFHISPLAWPDPLCVDDCLTIMACHGAIRTNQKLADKQMKALLEQLDSLEHASHCPHGRPTYVHQTLRQVEKDVKRIV